LKYPNEVIKTVRSHVEQHMQFRNVSIMRKGTLLRFMRQENFAELFALHKLDALAGSGNLENVS
jgi:hypothetical protein